jgi:hypothetical protein
VIAHSALPQIWRAPAYPPELHDFLLSLLERFEITFPIQGHAHKLGTLAILLKHYYFKSLLVILK